MFEKLPVSRIVLFDALLKVSPRLDDPISMLPTCSEEPVAAAMVALAESVMFPALVFVPLMLERLGRDPAMGSSVLLTFTTDSMGVFIFLGLATLLFR